VKVGFTIGGGAEWAFTDQWTAKAEYLWFDLGNVSHPLNCVVAGGVASGCQLGFSQLSAMRFHPFMAA